MERKKVLDLRGKENKSVLSLNLKGLENLQEINLSMDYLIKDGMKFFTDENIVKAKEVSILAERINGDSYDKRSINFKYRVLLKEAIINFNEDSNSLLEKLKSFKMLNKIDREIRRSFDLEFDDEFINLLDESEEIISNYKEEIYNFKNNKTNSLAEIIEFYCFRETIVEVKSEFNQLNNLKDEFLDRIHKAGKLNRDSFIKEIKSIFGSKYDEKFYYSKELEEGYLKISKFEKTEELLKEFDNFNLLYKFNRSRYIEERRMYIEEIGYEPIINISSMDRDIIIKNIMSSSSGIIFNLEDLKIKIDQLIALLNEGKKINVLIV